MKRDDSVLICVWVLLVAAGCGTPSANGPTDTYGLDFSLPAGSRTSGALVFFVDGVNGKIFQEMLDAGELPALKKYFVDRGTYAPLAVANVPSVTLANMTSFVTGRFPGHHNVVGVNWFDRNELIWRNYDTIAQKNDLDLDYVAPNLYEQFADDLTFSVFFQPHRRATKFYENWTSAGPPFFFKWYEFVDRLSLFRLKGVADIARQYERFPAVTVVYLLSPDFRAYGYGVGSEQYRQALKHTDRQIGRVLGDLQRAGLLDKVHIALLSDHSLGEVTHHLDLNRYLQEVIGLRIGLTHWWERDPFEERMEDMGKNVVMPYGSGDRYWAICLRRPIRQGAKVAGYSNWLVHPTMSDLKSFPTRKGLVDMPATLVKHEAVDAVAFAAGKDRVRVLRRAGEVEFRQPGGQGAPITYELISGGDPLGWDSRVPAEALKGKPMSPLEWLKATAASDYPDLPAQILAYFRASRAGDLAVFATPGWDFRTENRAGHGGLRPSDMCVPLMIAGPGVPHQRLDVARTVDLMPTLLTLLGRPLPPGMDGRPLVEKK